jgi:adenosylcobinamide amidohydrolase
VEPEVSRHDGAPVLVWRFASPLQLVSSAPVGGGIGTRGWIVNVQVPSDYSRVDLAAHVDEIARASGCTGAGTGMLTAAPVADVRRAVDGGVVAYATVGVTRPTWAADADDAISAYVPGTVNTVVFVPWRLGEAALVNAVITATEAKSQALFEAGVPGTGTASDAVCVACPADGAAEPFAGPRSRAGASIARAVHAAVASGVEWPR